MKTFEITVAEAVKQLVFEAKKQKQDLFIIKVGIGAIVIMLLMLTTYVSIRLGGPLF